MQIPLIAVTGGPASGKTETLEKIAREFGNSVQVAVELPTRMLEAFPIPGREIDPTPELMTLLQKGVIPSQLALEEWHKRAALEKGARLVICDRGLLDAAAYVPGGLSAFKKIVGLDISQIHSRYAKVIHLESLATANPTLYEKVKGSNQSRYETLEQAIEREMATRKAWENHPNRSFIEGSKGIEHVTASVLEIVSSYLEEEHERKFRLLSLPAISLGVGAIIEQGYLLTGPDFEMRVRTIDGVPYFGVKAERIGQSRLSRFEWERRISASFFKILWGRTEGRRIYKTRYKIQHGDFLLELDQYHGSHGGLVILECEAATADQLQELVLPAWAAGAEEVTEDSRFSNRELALAQKVPA